MTACLRMATVGDVLAALVWVGLAAGMAILVRREQVQRRRDARGDHNRAMRALERRHPSIGIRGDRHR